MSSSPVTQIEQVVVADKATKTRQPTLPDKYGKFIQFAYYMMENVLGDEFQMDKDVYLEKFKLFGNVGEQQVLVQGFLNSAKETKKTIKKLVSDRKKAEAKANKPPRPSRAKAAKATANADGEATTAKRSRKKATKEVVNAEDELLNDLVQLAHTEPVVATEPAKSPEKVASAPAEPVQTPEKAAAAEKQAKTPKAPKKAAKKTTEETA